MDLILASQSPYRRQLIEKIGIQFTCQLPTISEEELKAHLISQQLPPAALATELSRQKGLSVFNQLPSQQNQIVLAGDQLVQFQNEIIGKPNTFEKAFEQLKKMNNKTHQLITAVTLITEKKIIPHTHITELKMRHLSDQEITHYLKKDFPYDCAGSYKIENSGITLFETINCSDFTAIQGLPMLWLCNQLKELGYEFFTT